MFLINSCALGYFGGKEQKSDDRSVHPPGTHFNLFFFPQPLQHWITLLYNITYFANIHATLLLVAPPCCRDIQTRILELCHLLQLAGPRNAALR